MHLYNNNIINSSLISITCINQELKINKTVLLNLYNT